MLAAASEPDESDCCYRRQKRQTELTSKGEHGSARREQRNDGGNDERRTAGRARGERNATGRCCTFEHSRPNHAGTFALMKWLNNSLAVIVADTGAVMVKTTFPPSRRSSKVTKGQHCASRATSSSTSAKAVSL